jgi:hypothetical protein
VYSREKTLADCFKHRNEVGLDTVLEAVRMLPGRRVDGDIKIALCCSVFTHDRQAPCRPKFTKECFYAGSCFEKRLVGFRRRLCGHAFEALAVKTKPVAFPPRRDRRSCR